MQVGETCVSIFEELDINSLYHAAPGYAAEPCYFNRTCRFKVLHIVGREILTK